MFRALEDRNSFLVLGVHDAPSLQGVHKIVDITKTNRKEERELGRCT
jgi:hypothetical protein